MLSIFLALTMSFVGPTPDQHSPHHHKQPGVLASAARDGQLATLRAAISRYADFEVAQREGWKKFGGKRSNEGPLMGEHWLLSKERGGTDYQHGDELDFSRPSNLIYAEIAGRRQLVGVTFNVRLGDGEPVPEGFAGSDDAWHVHDFPRVLAAATETRPLLRWLANAFAPREFVHSGEGRGRVAMVHVWPTIPNPDGLFADKHRSLTYLKLGLPAAFADGASLQAAKGLHLATEHGCSDTIDGGLWIAAAPKKTAARLHATCGRAAEHVKQGLATGQKDKINRMAEHGWAMFDADWNRALTSEQRARIAAITEHGSAHDDAASAHQHDTH